MTSDTRSLLVPAPQMREAILAVTESLDGETEPRYVYVVPLHVKALRPEAAVVVGMRGSGKTVWATALSLDEIRKQLVRLVPNWPRELRVSTGFRADPAPESYPDSDSIAAILRAGHRARDLWRAIIAAHTWLGEAFPAVSVGSWKDRTSWIAEHPEEVAHGFAKYDQRLHADGRGHLLVFDALDRTGGDNWDRMRSLLRELLQIVLEFRSFKSLRLKLFVRPDMIDDPQVGAFPDASKVVADRLELDWRLVDLYGLLWQRLAHAPGEAGKRLRGAAKSLGAGDWHAVEDAWLVPERLAGEEGVQRGLFELLADKWMGRDPKRGRAYTWLPRHLGDSAGRSSPRSFLEAIRVAAEQTASDAPLALSAAGIREGVQAASQRRVTEIGEDHPWVRAAMEPLRDLLVPCGLPDVQERWNDDVMNAVKDASANKLPPRHLTEGPVGLSKDLAALGVFQVLDEGRINVPDVYRVAFGLRRRGGVPPLRR